MRLWLVDPAGLKGLWLRARAGPVRDHLTTALAVLNPRRLHPAMGDEALFGGADLALTLATGRLVERAGLLSDAGPLMLAMAERCPPGLAARLAQALDRTGPSLVALDEGAEPAEGLPPALADRLGLFVALDGIGWSDSAALEVDAEALAAASARLPRITCKADHAAALTRAAAELGIPSLRAPALALACARAHAALRGAEAVDEADLLVAAEMVLAHRAAPAPEAAPEPPEAPPPPDNPDPADRPDEAQAAPPLPEEILVEAARAALPEDLLARLVAGRMSRSARQAQGGAGQARKSNRRGRPLPARPGRPGDGARVDLVATLRAAAPWQRLRRDAFPALAARRKVLVLPADIRLRRYQETSDRVLIFVVDASGSAAVARLAEAKGAVELLLARAYARRDHVALVAFRGTVAEVLLPPTRSLVQAKRRLAGLPGGGGTPLAAGLSAAMDCAELARARGMTPTVALLTDGRGNIALDGTPGRAQAAADATRVARALAATATPAVVIDTALRPQPALAELAAAMGARCLVLPRADAARLSGALSVAMAAGTGP